ncbi:hypothetical protein FGB62_25g714 [Gracilaria domingensis]|nr:hypothetical protein FGB62_25g714 [Gracilaria domingensis]
MSSAQHAFTPQYPWYCKIQREPASTSSTSSRSIDAALQSAALVDGGPRHAFGGTGVRHIAPGIHHDDAAAAASLLLHLLQRALASLLRAETPPLHQRQRVSRQAHLHDALAVAGGAARTHTSVAEQAAAKQRRVAHAPQLLAGDAARAGGAGQIAVHVHGDGANRVVTVEQGLHGVAEAT